MTLVAEKVRYLFRDLFGVEAAEDDDFFELGGDSLAGETLLSGIERDFGVALPLSILLEASTPRSIAEAVTMKMGAAPSAILFTVRSAGSRTPLFCIHGANGAATFARKIRDVVHDRPIYAIRAFGLLPGEIPYGSIQEMARAYITEIRSVRPSGPYHLFGQCKTANVALEIAEQLSAAGEQVETVTLADPGRVNRRWAGHRLYHWLAGRHAVFRAGRFPQMSGNERWHKLAKPALRAAIRAYKLRPYAGRVLIVGAVNKADEIVDPKRGYKALIPNLDTVIVEGVHKDVFKDMDPASPGPLARALSAFLTSHD